MAAASWLHAEWTNGTLTREQQDVAADVVAHIFGAYPTECASDAAACAGWTALGVERF